MVNRGSYVLKSVLVGLCVSIMACEKKADLTQDKGKYSYSVGVQIAKNLKDQGIDLDVVAFSTAVKDVLDGKDMRIPDEERMTALRKMSEGMREKEMVEAKGNLEKGKAFLDENKKKEGVKETASGLQYKVIAEGEGKPPKPTSTVEVHYRGRLIDGKEFDSSYSRNQPAQFPVNGVIPGWTEALQLMKPGAKYELAIPAYLAYGERGNPSIPPNSVLVFDVELIKVIK